jgi:hypothetical protein
MQGAQLLAGLADQIIRISRREDLRQAALRALSDPA